MPLPYVDIANLPAAVLRAFPRKGQLICRAAFNNAWLRGDGEAACHRIAWSAVKRHYRWGSTGTWPLIADRPGE